MWQRCESTKHLSECIPGAFWHHVLPCIFLLTKTRGRENLTDLRGDHCERREGWWIQRQVLAHLHAQGESANDLWHMDNFSNSVDHFLVKIVPLKASILMAFNPLDCKNIKGELRSSAKKAQDWVSKVYSSSPTHFHTHPLLFIAVFIDQYLSMKAKCTKNQCVSNSEMHFYNFIISPRTIYTRAICTHQRFPFTQSKHINTPSCGTFCWHSHNILSALRGLPVKMIN